MNKRTGVTSQSISATDHVNKSVLLTSDYFFKRYRVSKKNTKDP